jgi:hypothetical protein
MTNRNKWLRTGIALAAFSTACFAKTPTLSGKMVAYDPLLHAAKDASFQANKEEVILETAGPKTKFIKVVFVGFGTKQVDEKYFDGSTPLSVQVLRDRTCDEKEPRFVTEIDPHRGSGTYLLTDAFKNSPPAKIKRLDCYEATKNK